MSVSIFCIKNFCFSDEYSEHIVWRKLDRKNSLISKGIHLLDDDELYSQAIITKLKSFPLSIA